mgnify:CR=1 FL=1
MSILMVTRHKLTSTKKAKSRSFLNQKHLKNCMEVCLDLEVFKLTFIRNLNILLMENNMIWRCRLCMFRYMIMMIINWNYPEK